MLYYKEPQSYVYADMNTCIYLEENPKTVAHFFFSLYNVLCKLIFKHPVIHGFLVLL